MATSIVQLLGSIPLGEGAGVLALSALVALGLVGRRNTRARELR